MTKQQTIDNITDRIFALILGAFGHKNQPEPKPDEVLKKIIFGIVKQEIDRTE